MPTEVKIPSPGESITQVQLAGWLVKDGDFVEKDQEICEIDSDKATLAIPSPESGRITLLAQEGDTLPIGAVICTIEPGDAPPAGKEPATEKQAEEKKPAARAAVPAPTAAPPVAETAKLKFTPLARKVLQEQGVAATDAAEWILKSRISRKDVELLLQQKEEAPAKQAGKQLRETERKKMTPLRMKLSERLVAVKNQTAMLTTFNEVDMSSVLEIKATFGDKFREKYGVSIGLTSFFTRACALALKEFPLVNARIDGDELVIPGYVDMGIAVSAPKGLVVPVIRHAESLSLAEIEQQVKELANKARNNRITLEEMAGGTFTITNGGVFGSLLSTPILNPPQSAILGLHAISDRPVAVKGQVVIRPMMYVALSYDHRIIDGRESVSFLVRVKEILENPVRMLAEGRDPFQVLLGL